MAPTGGTFAEVWKFLQTELESRNQKLIEEYEAAWTELDSLVQSVADQVELEDKPPDAAPELAAIRALIEGVGQRLLFDPVAQLGEIRPQGRALDAYQAHQTSLADLARMLPQSVSVSGEEMLNALGARGGSWLSRFALRRRREILLPVRDLVQRWLLAETSARAQSDGAFFLVLAKAYPLVLSPWQDIRRDAFRALTGEATSRRAFQQNRDAWLRQVDAWGDASKKASGNARRRMNGAMGRLAAALLRGGVRPPGEDGAELLNRNQERFRYWSRQQRAVSAAADLELGLARLSAGIADATESSLRSLDAEQEALASELDSVIDWLRQARDGAASGDFPPPAARLAAAEERTRDWLRQVESAAHSRLPLFTETVEPRKALPPRREPWRRLEPGKTFLTLMEDAGRPAAVEGFREAELAHKSVVGEIERAREVVTFGLETAASEGAEGQVIARESIDNSLSLTSYKKGTAVYPRPQVERKLVQGAAAALLFTHLGLERSRLGFLAQLARRSGTRAAREAQPVLRRHMAAAGGRVHRSLRGRYQWLQRKLGWEPPPVTVPAPVLIRRSLVETLSLRRSRHDEPMIYRRLFRLAPVEDPRFLVGREAEMAALAEALRAWQTGRPVSIVIVGARGSGKTSLLNCALAGGFSDVTVLRSQFSERITDALQMREFLRRLLQIGPDQDVVEALSRKKTVVMLEETERTFLRRLNGFDGLRELLTIVSASARTTLWILTLNQQSSRYLDAAIGLGEYFSHRINAMAVSPESLKSAVLLRHNLSGLRLQYPTVPSSDPRAGRLRKLLGLERGVEEMFFESLYRQSHGVFRGAFELWQHYMERVEGGVLYMSRPVEPDIEPLIEQLTLEDAYSLNAILQHGGLTSHDHAQVFECPVEQSQARLERLLGFECLEPDPAGPGLRIRPEAGRLTHLVLDRLNLI